MKKITALLFVVQLLLLASCNKSDDYTGNNTMNDLKVPDGFDWSTNIRLKLEVDVHGLSNGTTLALYNLEGEVVDKQSIFDNHAIFEFQVDNITDTLRLYSPESRKSHYFTADQGHIDFGTSQSMASRLSIADFALAFDGTQQNYVQINNNEAGGIVSGYPFTFSAWIKTPGPADGTDDMVIVSIADPSYASKYYGICIRNYSSSYKPVIVARDGGSERVKSFNQNLADDTWHQVVGVFSSSNTRKLYIDGNYTGQSTSEVSFIANAINTNIGRWGDNTPSEYFNGMIDNVMIWDKALSDEEIMNYYNNPPAGNESNLVGMWNFNEGAGTSITNNATAGGYDGTLQGSTFTSISDPIPDADGDGVNDDDDYFPSDATKAYNIVYPSGNKFYYHLYEDLWPSLGDYDFNDIVLKTKLHVYTNAQNKLVGGRVISTVYWIGGGIPRGAGMEWFASNGNASQLKYMPDNTVVFTEADNVVTDPIVKNAVQLFNDNIIESLNQTVDFEFDWDYQKGGNSLWVQVYIYNERNREIHMFGHPPTEAQDMNLFGTGNDASQTTWNWSVGIPFSNPTDFYKTVNKLPWGLEISAREFRVPLEKVEIIDAYPQFKAWAESGGTQSRDWYNYPDESKTFVPE